MTRWFTMTMMVGIGSAVSLRAATDYLYGIGSDWALYRIAVDPTALTVSVKKESINLTGYIPGWGTRYNEALNGLGVDSSTGDIYFNYSYNDSATSSAGTQSVVPFIYQKSSGSYRAPYALGAAITSTALPASDVSAGWLPRGTFYSGAYYAAMQLNDTFVALPISGSGTKSYTAVAKYTDWDHTSGVTSMSGGDFVIGSNSVIYGSTVVSGANVFFRQQLSNATNSATGSAWTSFNLDALVPHAWEGSAQVAGLGGSANLYLATTTGQNFYLVNGYDGPSTPTLTQIGGSSGLGVSFADLSIALASPLPVPEMTSPGILAGGFVCLAMGEVACRRRRRREGFRIRVARF